MCTHTHTHTHPSTPRGSLTTMKPGIKMFMTVAEIRTHLFQIIGCKMQNVKMQKCKMENAAQVW